MKAICKIVRLRGRKSSALASLDYIFAKGALVCGECTVGVFTGKASVDAAIFTASCDGFGDAAEVRHIVISSDEKPSPEVMRTLALMAEDWARIWADGRAWVGVAHSDKDHAHIHLVIANRGADGRCPSLGSQRHRGNADLGIYGTRPLGTAWHGPYFCNAVRASSRCRKKPHFGTVKKYQS